VKTKQLLLSLLSTALFSLGLVRMAETVDPLRVVAPVQENALGRTAPECTLPSEIPNV